MKRLICTVMLLTLLMGNSVYAKESTYTGLCGENVTYNFNESTGILYLSGPGTVGSYTSPEELPWYTFKEKITTIIIGDNVTCPIWYLNNSYYGR